MKYTLPLLVFLAGCAQTDAIKSQAVETISGASDSALQDAELVMCRGITVGAWVRAYGSDPDKAAAWRKLCSVEVKATP
jgi:hypothetical protein